VTVARDYRPSVRSLPYPQPGEGEEACVACGELYAEGKLREHLETACGGAAWKKRELLEKIEVLR
jgi:hypothetical protein